MAHRVKRPKKEPPYSVDPLWADIIPIPQNDGGPNALAAIAYTAEYSEAMSYLRAVMAAEEHSERVLELTGHLVGMNPSHYTVWLYRAKTLFALDKDLREEIEWLNGIALVHLKNYQIWHHRQLLMTRLGDPTGEAAFLRSMFERDSKNYHVWSYRQWLVRRFDLWDTELPDVEELIDEDVRNNSAWNHRYFLVFGRGKDVENEVVVREIEYAKSKITLAPQNQSPWNYLRGALTASKLPLLAIADFSSQLAPLDKPSEVRSSHALDVLADIYAEQAGKQKDAATALDLLANRYDPIRAGYWNWRKSQLAETSVAASAAVVGA